MENKYPNRIGIPCKYFSASDTDDDCNNKKSFNYGAYDLMSNGKGLSDVCLTCKDYKPVKL